MTLEVAMVAPRYSASMLDRATIGYFWLPPVQFVQNFKYLSSNAPVTKNWSICFGSKLQARWKIDYMLENQCMQSDDRWKVKLMLFNAMVTQVVFTE